MRLRGLVGGGLVVAATVAVLALAPSQQHFAAIGGGQPNQVYSYPSPSFWPQSPYPVATAHHEPTPEVSVVPCPTWAPTLIQHSDGSYECKAYIPPDPGGPVLASPTT